MSAEIFSLARCRERIRWWLSEEVKAAELPDSEDRRDMLRRCSDAILTWQRRLTAFERFAGDR